MLAEGYAPWEVRIRASDHGAARDLADRLEAEGYGVVRRWDTVIAGCASREDAKALADRLHGEVEAGGELVWEALQGASLHASFRPSRADLVPTSESSGIVALRTATGSHRRRNL